jgi:hypothetical protein
MAKPEVIATQFVPPATAAVPCANAGTANTDVINSMNINIPNFRIVILLV